MRSAMLGQAKESKVTGPIHDLRFNGNSVLISRDK